MKMKQNKSKKIGLFGGSFNPIHNHHIKMANHVLEKNVADEVWIVPCKNHPFNKNLAPANHRINMINLAFNNPKIKVDKTEINSNKTNYTINTIRKLKSQYPHEFYWIIGSDVLHEMKEEWYGLPELFKETEFIIFNRNNYLIHPLKSMKIKSILEIKTNNESSTEIRERIKQKKPLKNLIPLSIEEYIIKNRLYQK